MPEHNTCTLRLMSALCGFASLPVGGGGVVLGVVSRADGRAHPIGYSLDQDAGQFKKQRLEKCLPFLFSCPS